MQLPAASKSFRMDAKKPTSCFRKPEVTLLCLTRHSLVREPLLLQASECLIRHYIWFPLRIFFFTETGFLRLAKALGSCTRPLLISENPMDPTRESSGQVWRAGVSPRSKGFNIHGLQNLREFQVFLPTDIKVILLNDI